MHKFSNVLKCDLLALYLFFVGFLSLYILLKIMPLTLWLILICINSAWAIYWGDYYSAIKETKQGDSKIIFFNKCLLVSFICGWVLYGYYHAGLVYWECINKWVNKE